jgi:hypothetical protein
VRKSKNIKDGNEFLEEDKKKFKLIPEKYTIWDYLVINNSMTIRQFIEYIKKEFNVDVNSINSNQINLYLKNVSSNDIFDNKIEEIYNDLSSIKLFENKKFIMLEISGDYENYYAKMPLFKYNFK